MSTANTLKGLGSMMLGGTISKVTGGKFANGAVTAGFAWAASTGVNAGINSKRDIVTREFIENNVRHFTDSPSNETPIPQETVDALLDVGRTDSGSKAFRNAISSGDTIDLLELITDDGHSFLTFDFEDGTNQIIYTRDVQGSIDKNIEFSISNRKLESSTLGSLLSHEIGHTSIGGSLGEVEASSVFENDFRRTFNLPLVDGYSESEGGINGVCKYEDRF